MAKPQPQRIEDAVIALRHKCIQKQMYIEKLDALIGDCVEITENCCPDLCDVAFDLLGVPEGDLRDCCRGTWYNEYVTDEEFLQECRDCIREYAEYIHKQETQKKGSAK